MEKEQNTMARLGKKSDEGVGELMMNSANSFKQSRQMLAKGQINFFAQNLTVIKPNLQVIKQ